MEKHRNETWLKEHYLEHGLSTIEMADLAGCTISAIRYWLKKYGVQIRSRSEAKRLAATRALKEQPYTDADWLHRKYWDDGLDTNQIAQEVGVSGPTIVRWMQRLGVPRRNKSQAGKKSWREDKERRERFSEGIRAAWERGVFDEPEYRETISRKAKLRWENGHYDGEKHPRWLGGKSNEPYPLKFNDEYKEMIRERDGRRCVLCGMDEEENGRRLSVHHITYDKDNLDPDLKVSLCDSCHGKTNSNREFWKQVFTRFWRRVPVADWQHKQVVT